MFFEFVNNIRFSTLFLILKLEAIWIADTKSTGTKYPSILITILYLFKQYKNIRPFEKSSINHLLSTAPTIGFKISLIFLIKSLDI